MALCPDAECLAARSVHLAYKTESEVTLFYNEVKVEQTTPCSYFMVCGWRFGYFGIQQLNGSEDKVVLFSLWDSSCGDEQTVETDDKVRVENVGNDVIVDRFGGEGTGAKLMAPFPWQLGEIVSCCVTACNDGNLTAYTGWIKHPKTKDWWRLGTLKTKTNGILLTGLYSFVEDFRRDRVSAEETRRAYFSNGWVKTSHGHWTPLSKAHFTASSADWEAKDSIDAGTCCVRGFYLCTGGKVQPNFPLNSELHFCRDGCSPPKLPFAS